MRRLYSGFFLLLVSTAIFGALTAEGQSSLGIDASYSEQPSLKPRFVAEYRPSYPFDTNVLPENFHNPYLWLGQASRSSAKAPKPSIEKVKRATIDPSMVGYIDNAIVHSEVRVRFDAAMDDKTPDRAEFFYAKCGCYATLPPGTGAFDPNAPGPGPGIPRAVNFQQLYFYGEYAPRPHFSLFMQLPFRWLQAQSFPGSGQAFPSNGGFGDVQIGLKFAPLVSSTHTLTFQFKTFLPSGDASLGLGTNHISIEPSLLYYQRLSGRLAVEAEVGNTHPLSSSAGVPTVGSHGFAGDVFFYGAGPSFQFIKDENFGLAGVFEVVGWNVRSGYVTGPANADTSGVNIVNVKVGPRFAFGSHHSLYIGYGIALTSENWYRDIFRTEYRYSF